MLEPLDDAAWAVASGDSWTRSTGAGAGGVLAGAGVALAGADAVDPLMDPGDVCALSQIVEALARDTEYAAKENEKLSVFP